MPKASEYHKCPVNGCDWSVTNDQLMCKVHWHMVPNHLQSRVYRLFHTMLKFNTPENIDRHKTACLEATEAVHLAINARDERKAEQQKIANQQMKLI